MKTKEQEPSISKDISISQVVSMVNSLFTSARITKPTADELNLMVLRDIMIPMRVKSPKGRSKFTKFMQGYIYGCVQTNRELLWKDLEFCYLVEGELYSTWRGTSKRSTEELYKAGLGSKLQPLNGEFYWKDSLKPFTNLNIEKTI